MIIIITILHHMGRARQCERLAECCRSSAVRNLEFDETAPPVVCAYANKLRPAMFCLSHTNSMRCPTVFRQPLIIACTAVFLLKIPEVSV